VCEGCLVSKREFRLTGGDVGRRPEVSSVAYLWLNKCGKGLEGRRVALRPRGGTTAAGCEADEAVRPRATSFWQPEQVLTGLCFLCSLRPQIER